MHVTKMSDGKKIRMSFCYSFSSMLTISFNADPDTVIHVNVNPDPVRDPIPDPEPGKGIL
jgi:hypothetical protein